MVPSLARMVGAVMGLTSYVDHYFKDTEPSLIPRSLIHLHADQQIVLELSYM